MFEEYTQKARLSDRVKKWLLIFPSVIAFGVILGAVAGLYSLRSQRQARLIRRIEEQTQALLNSIRVGIVESGFLKRSVGGSDLYVPMLTLLISNVSTSTIENLVLSAYFVSEGIFSCQSSVRIFRLGPGETTEAALKCIEPTGFGSVLTGVTLSQTMQPVSYRVQVHCDAAYATVQRGTSTFSLLRPVPPIPVK